jgi:hypothetical protein
LETNAFAGSVKHGTFMKAYYMGRQLDVSVVVDSSFLVLHMLELMAEIS